MEVRWESLDQLGWSDPRMVDVVDGKSLWR
jgi:hypothetical protein